VHAESIRIVGAGFTRAREFLISGLWYGRGKTPPVPL